MIKKRLEWLKRGLCITLAGAMIICSDTMTFAAEAADGQAVEQTVKSETGTRVLTDEQSDQTEGTEKTGKTEVTEAVENTKNREVTEALENTKNSEAAETAENTESIEVTEAAETTESTEVTETTENTESSEAAETTETTEGTEVTETTENTESSEATETTENTGSSEATETTENTESSEATETTENTESSEVTETTETTEVTEETEVTETTETPETKEANASDLVLVAKQKYAVVSVGETVKLPEYSFAATGDSAPDVEWLVDDNTVVSIKTSTVNGKLAGEAKALNAGIAVLTLQVKDNPNDKDMYYVVVKPGTAPASCTPEATYNSVSLSWEKVSDADGYTITRKEEGTDTEQMIAHVDGADTVSYKDTGVQTGTSYIYHVYAYTSYTNNGKQDYANTDKFAAVKATPQLGKAVLTSVSAEGYSSLTLTWKKVDGASGYEIYRSTDKSKVDTLTGDVNSEALSYADASVEAGKTYYYKVQPYCVVNGKKVYGDASDVLSGKRLPSATSLTAESAGYKEVKLTWSAVDGVTGYEVSRKTSSSSYKKIATVTGGKTGCSDTKVTAGTAYTYKVRAYKTVNGSKVYGDDSNEVTVTPVLAAPQITLKNVSYNSVTITWNQISGAHGYKVYRSTKKDSGYKAVKTINDKTTLTFIDKKLSAGKKYYYKVCAFRTVGGKNAEGEYSDVQSIKAAPEAVTLKSEAAGATAVKLTWNKVDMPSTGGGYAVYQIVNGTDSLIKRCSAKSTSYTVTGLTAGQKYTFKVVTFAKDKNGKRAYGGTSNELTVTPKLLKVSIDTIKAGKYNSAVLSWNITSAGDEDGYIIYRSDSKNGKYKQLGTTVKKSGSMTASYTDKNVKVGKKYYYKVVTYKNLADGNVIRSGYSGAKGYTARPGTAAVKIKSAGNESLKITWKKVKTSKNSYVKGYVIYRSTTENGKYRKIKTINKGTTTSYVDKGLVTGNTYYYKVRTFSKSGGKTIYSDYSAPASMQVIPGKPSIQVVAANYNTVTISWKKIEGCDGYRIYRATEADGKYKSVKTCDSANTLSYKNSELETGKTYYYKVRAYINKNGKKIFSDYSIAKQATPVLTKPSGLYATSIAENQIKVTWDTVDGAETYTILRSNSENGTYKIATELCTTNSFVDYSAVTGKTYYYKIYAVRGSYISETTDCVSVVASSLELSTTSVLMKTGTNVKVTATAKPSGVVYWTSSDSTIAVVSSDGTIYGLKAGTTTIKASANGITKEITVTVKDKLDTENKIIDISSDNGTVDFGAIKAGGYECVMLRISKGTTEDAKFQTNYKNAKAAGLKVGVYCCSVAQNAVQAKAEGDKVLNILNAQKLDYPVVYVLDDISLLYNNVTAAQRIDFINAFKTEIIDGGKQYKFALGLSQKLLEQYPGRYVDTSKLTGTDLWIINYRAESLGSGYQGKGNVAMWRYTDQGTVNGVNGKVNISIRYKVY